MKKPLKFKLLLPFFFVFYQAFAQDNTAPTRVIVLCDISNSITKSSSKNQSRLSEMENTCSKLIRFYPEGSEISFYFISSNGVPTPFLSLKAPPVTQTGRSRIRKQLKLLDTALVLRIESEAKKSEKATCILGSIESAYDNFAAGNTMHPGLKNVLIIFSDMLEQCHNTSIGEIWMNEKKGAPILPADQQRKIANYSPERVLGNIYIQIINTSPYMDKKLAGEVKKIWTQLFVHLGSEQARSGKLYFLSSLDFEPRPEYK
jgi:hypothetical protein